jgi:hypothetical protein
LKASEKVYWIKAGFSIISAVLSFSLQQYFGVDGSLIFMIGALVYLAFSDILSTIMKLDRNHGLKIGIGAYIFLWITAWTLLYTVYRPTTP